MRDSCITVVSAGYDVTHSTARCYCNKGWSGIGCSQPGDATPSVVPAPDPAPSSSKGAIAGSLVGGVIGGAVLLAAVVAIKAKMSGSTFVDAIDFSFGLGGGGAAKVGSGGGYSAAPSFTGAAFTGAADAAYVAPDADAGSSSDGTLLA